MTQKVHLSFDRRIRNREVSAAIQYGGGTKGFISEDGERLVEDSEGDLPSGDLGTFDVEAEDGLTVTIGAGEALVEGAYIATDETFDVDLNADETEQSVYIGWRDGVPDEIVVGLDGAFGSADHQLEAWRFDADGESVASSSDQRVIGQTLGVDVFSYDQPSPSTFNIDLQP